ncbi:MAG: ATP-binding protein [Cyclobacteriaceae bacterium]
MSHPRDLPNSNFQKERSEAQKELLIQAYGKIQKTLKELKETQERLIESERLAAVGQLIAGVAHEVNSPLFAIDGSAKIVRAKLNELLHQSFLLGAQMNQNEIQVFSDLVMEASKRNEFISSSQIPDLQTKYIDELKAFQINEEDCNELARILVKLDVLEKLETFSVILTRSNAVELLQFINQVYKLYMASWIISDSSKKAGGIVKALKSQSYDRSSENETFSISESIDAILTIYQSEMKDIELSRNYAEVRDHLGDCDRISQVWINLLTNAMYASNNSGKIEIEIAGETEYTVISFKDYAGGIPLDIRKRIFEPFFTTKPRGKGTGLGLALCKQIVEEFNGQLLVEVEENVGTKMIVKLKHNENTI